MSDPKRLLDEGAGDLGATLLRSARALDPERARARKAAILGAAAGIGAAASVAKAAVPTARGIVGAGRIWAALSLGRTVMISVLALAVTAGVTAHVLTRPIGPRAAPLARAILATHPRTTTPAAPREAAAVPAAPSPAPAAPSIDVDLELADPVVTHRVQASPIVNDGSAKLGAPHAPAAGLAEEAAALREAREALGSGQASRALAALDAYARRFPGGLLALEAEVLRIEALRGAGNGAAAQARARAFLAAHPTSPYARRIRALSGAEEAPLPGAAGDSNP